MEDVSKRYKTLPLKQLDGKTLSEKICSDWRRNNDARAEFMDRREEYTSNWRDLQKQESHGPWENSSNFKNPLTLSFGKATHARLWQIFADPQNLFGVKARNESFESREEKVQQFMQWVIQHFCNGKRGTRDVFDEWLWDDVFEGSGYLKLWWQRDVKEYLEVVPVLQTQETITFDRDNLTGVSGLETKMTERDEVREEVIETPHLGRILMEDILLPEGQSDPQTSRWLVHRIFYTEDEIKARALEGKFDREAVEDALLHCHQKLDAQNDQIKQTRREIDGYFDYNGVKEGFHSVFEWHGKAYVKKEIDGNEYSDIDQMPKDVVIWVHQASGKMLGWTYLYRISPSGIRPVFKADFVKFPDRSTGVGVPEMLDSTQQALDAVYNLRQDNGVLASTPFGFYRAMAGIKPDKWRIEPGTMVPVDDPQQDVRIVQMPFLGNFGYQEEDRLNSYGEKLINISELQMSSSPQKVGLFRTASGANAVQQEAGIQLEIHFDRLARTLSKLLEALFILCRERMPEKLYYRVTGESGRPIFGAVNREDLKGSYDFEINVDILGESRTEAQQKAVMLMQTLINPAFTNTGVVTPANLYALAKNFLQKNRFRRIDNYITAPQQYEGDFVTPDERVFRIVNGNFQNPPVEDTVRLGENHEQAIKAYEAFKASDHYGLLTQPAQLKALEGLIAKHQQLMAAAQAGANPNITGMQVPREGFSAMDGMAAGQEMSQGPMGAPMGEANGPMV